MQRLEQKNARVVGANGAFGKAVGAALSANGWQVTGFMRNAKPGTICHHIIEGIAQDQSKLVSAVKSQDLVVYSINPPYDKSANDALPMLENTVFAAKASGAAILFPGNIHNYGSVAGELLDENSPQNPLTGALAATLAPRLKI